MAKVHGHMKIVRRVPVLALRLNNVPRRELLFAFQRFDMSVDGFRI